MTECSITDDQRLNLCCLKIGGILMTVTLSVQNVPKFVAHNLQLRAKQHHRTLQEELRAILEEAAAKISTQTSKRVLTPNFQRFYLADYLIPEQPESYIKLDSQTLTIKRDEALNIFVTFPKQIFGKIALSDNQFYPLISTQKGDCFNSMFKLVNKNIIKY